MAAYRPGIPWCALSDVFIIKMINHLHALLLARHHRYLCAVEAGYKSNPYVSAAGAHLERDAAHVCTHCADLAMY